MANCARCEFRADDLSEHAAESQHWLCVVCGRRSLTEQEAQTCAPCVARIRGDLAAVIDLTAQLESAIEETAYRSGRLPGGDALVMSGDGSMDSPQTPNQYTEPRLVEATVHVEHAEIVGESFAHPAYVEQRIPSDGREHVRDHWPSDPTPVIAVVEANERDWRHTFGDEPASELATVSGCVGYLMRNLDTGHRAAQTHPGFDEFAAEIRDLRARLERVQGLAEYALGAPIPCGCGGKLVQEYGDKGLTDERRCRECGNTYTANEYAFRLRLLTDTPGWVSPDQAARLIDRPVVTVKAWVARLDLPAVCNRLTKRLLVDAEAARVLAEERPARKRAG